MVLWRYAVLVILAVAVVSCGAILPIPTPTAIPTATAIPTHTVMPTATPIRISRASFFGIVRNELSTRIIARFGPPDSTQSSGGTGREYWYYHGLTVDPTTQKADGTIQVVLDRYSDGVLIGSTVNFGP